MEKTQKEQKGEPTTAPIGKDPNANSDQAKQAATKLCISKQPHGQCEPRRGTAQQAATHGQWEPRREAMFHKKNLNIFEQKW